MTDAQAHAIIEALAHRCRLGDSPEDIGNFVLIALFAPEMFAL